MDPMVGLNIVTLVMASISLALSTLSALPHVKGLATLLKYWFRRTRDAFAGVMAVVGVVTIVVVGANYFGHQLRSDEYGVSDADSVVAPSLRANEIKLSAVPAAQRDTSKPKCVAVEPISDSRD